MSNVESERLHIWHVFFAVCILTVDKILTLYYTLVYTITL